MAKFTISIATDNAAFEGDPAGEIAPILREIADKVAQTLEEGRYFTSPVRDSNGNTVGKYTFTK